MSLHFICRSIEEYKFSQNLTRTLNFLTKNFPTFDGILGKFLEKIQVLKQEFLENLYSSTN